VNEDVLTFLKNAHAERHSSPIVTPFLQEGIDALVRDIRLLLLPDFGDLELGQIMVAMSILLRATEATNPDAVLNLKTFFGLAGTQLYYAA
jgi:hypothetical protein